MTSEDAARRAQRGATLLDAKRKGWASEIDPHSYHPQSLLTFDALTELYDRHEDGLAALEIPKDSPEERDYGFAEPTPPAVADFVPENESEATDLFEDADDDEVAERIRKVECARLKKAWVAEIELRTGQHPWE